MDGRRHTLMVRRGSVGGEAAIEEGISKLAKRFLSIKVHVPHHHCPTIVCWLDNDIVMATEVMKSDQFNLDDGPARSFFEIESIDQHIAVVHEQVQAAELAWRQHPV